MTAEAAELVLLRAARGELPEWAEPVARSILLAEIEAASRRCRAILAWRYEFGGRAPEAVRADAAWILAQLPREDPGDVLIRQMSVGVETDRRVRT